jgi:hypothetical protein
MEISTFVGLWTIQYTGGVEGTFLQDGWRLYIGTGGLYGDQKPFLTEEYAVCVGFAVVDAGDPENPVVQLSTDGQDGAQPLVLRLTGEQLRWKGYYKQKPVYIYISAAETLVPGGKNYVHLFGSTTYGDPDQVAVWGGSGNPPPLPDPPTPKDGGS